jgi:hypothetical protein
MKQKTLLSTNRCQTALPFFKEWKKTLLMELKSKQLIRRAS